VGLREIAEADLQSILGDLDGFGWPITVIDPSGNSQGLLGFSNDISQLIDPDTGQAVSGRLASVALSMSALSDVGLGLPQGIADAGIKPWVVQFDDIQGNLHTFKVAQSNPDRALGLVTCVLEAYQ
jgi:hypothetical protein